jgi:hypothetical protein
MVKDAELNAEEDKKVKNWPSRATRPTLVHSTRSLTEYGDKLEPARRRSKRRSPTWKPRSSRATRRDRRQGDRAVDRFAEAGREDVRRHAGAAAAGGAKLAPRQAASRPSRRTTWSTPTSRKSKTASNRRHPAPAGTSRAADSRGGRQPLRRRERQSPSDVRAAGSAFPKSVQNTSKVPTHGKA